MKGQAGTVVLIIIFASLLAISILGGAGIREFFGGGLIVNSITPPSNNLGRWTISATASQGGANTLVATITPDQTAELANTNIATEFPITISASNPQEKFTFVPSPGNRIPIYDLDWEFSGGLFLSCDTTFPDGAPWDWDLRPPFYPNALTPNIGGNGWCVNREQIGFFGVFPATPAIERSVDINIVVNGQTATATISNLNQAVPLTINGQNVGQVTATGLLLTGSPQPDLSAYSPAYVNGMWKLIDNNIPYNAESTTTFNQLTQWQGSTWLDPTQVNNLLNNYKNFISQNFLVTDTIPPELQWVNRQSEDDAGLVKVTNGNGFSTNLNLQILLDADWVGFVVLSGQPDIISASCPEFEAGDPNAVVTGQIKNIGEGDGVFALTLEGCGFEFYGSESISVGAGETKSFSINRLNLNPGTVTETCILRARDIGDPAKEDSVSLTCSQRELEFCIEGEFNVQGNKIYKCIGGKLELQETCEFGVDVVNNIPFCRVEDGATKTQTKEGGFDFITILLAIAVMAIVASAVVKAVKK
jgi:hypothetical protein